jgi:tetratricopeptide (TPR) repeat protein
MSKNKKPTGGPAEGGKVVSILGAIGRRRAADAREQASATHLRALEGQADLLENLAALDAMDLDDGIAELEGDETPEGRMNWAMVRALRALQRCRRGDVEAGLAEWEETAAAVPGAASVYILRASWFASDPARALADLDRAVEADPKNAGAYARRGDCLRVLGDGERALANYRRALALDPKLVDVHHMTGALLAARGDHEAAIASFDRAVRLAPKYVDFYLDRGASLEALGRFERAAADYARVLDLDPSRADACVRRIECLKRAGKILEAAEAGARFVKNDRPDEPEPHAVLGAACLVKGRPEEAIEHLSRALALAPDDATVLGNRGRAYAQTGEWQPAFEDADRAAALAPGVAKHHEDRGIALGKLGRAEEAVAALSRAIELEPGVPHRHMLRAVYLCEVVEDEEGAAQIEADIRRAIALNPGELLYRRKLGEYLENRSDLDAAIVAWSDALALAPDDASLWFHRGRCKSRLAEGRYERGVDVHETPEEREQRGASALADLEKAFELGLRDFDVHWEMIGAREEMSDKAAYQAMIDRTVEAFPDDVMPLALRYSHRRHRGDVEGAAADRARLLALGFQPDA